MSDFNITLFEACELLNRSKKSISRYIRRDLLHPEKVKSRQGTLEYRFSKADIEAFKAQEAEKADQTGHPRPDRTEGTDQTGHIKTGFIENKEVLSETRQDTPDQTGQTRQDNEVVKLLKETTGLLRSQLYIKDKQIGSLGGKIDQLIERDRETNILIGQLQSKVLMLEKPKTEETGHDPDQTGQTRQDRGDTGDGTGQDKEKPAKAGFWKQLFKSDL